MMDVALHAMKWVVEHEHPDYLPDGVAEAFGVWFAREYPEGNKNVRDAYEYWLSQIRGMSA